MQTPNYENYSIDELNDALETIDRYEYPENYTKILEALKVAKVNANIPPTEEEVAEKAKKQAHNNKLKKRFFIIIGSFIVLIIASSILSPKDIPYQKALNYIQNDPKLADQIGQPIEEVGEAIVSKSFGRFPSETYEIKLKGSKGEATLRVSMQIMGNFRKYISANLQFNESEEVIEFDLKKLNPSPNRN